MVTVQGGEVASAVCSAHSMYRLATIAKIELPIAVLKVYSYSFPLKLKYVVDIVNCKSSMMLFALRFVHFP